ncbi:family 78 glycoside hydrolase catalytic domain [Lysobacter korlensis]|uniref:alpha-L-rhamnosidase n=1 Tax=Lysobacter korlensis TaxID=553636 RepID=A0ABV6RX21_9GAMM
MMETAGPAQLLDAAQWIEPVEASPREPGNRPGFLLRRSFEVDGDVLSAVVSATAHGIYELFLNGTRVGDEELTPGFTAYRKRLQVHSFDVTHLLVPGENVLGAILTDGWFRGRHGFERRADGFGTRTALLAALHVDDGDGTRIAVATDGSWMSRTGHITRADLMDGQAVDFRLLNEGWCSPGASSDAWTAASLGLGDLYQDRNRLVAPIAPPVRRIEELRPVSTTTPRPGTAVVDFGQNINGWIRLSELGPEGTRLVLTHGEWVDDDGFISTDHLRAFDFATHELLPAGQVDDVISAGRDGDVFEPRHTTHGFQYVQVDGLRGDLDPDTIRAVVVHSDLEPVGEFECSDPRLQALHEAVRWSFRDNACDIPTDCPQRERSGFTGDWQVFLPTAALLYDVETFSEKWLADLRADQSVDGRVPTVTPNPAGDGPSGNAFEDLATGSAGWGDAAVIVPWELWRAYGDLGVLRRSLPSMCGWVDYAARSAAEGRHPDRAAARPSPAPHEQFLWDTGFHFGEWLEPGVPPRPDPAADHGIVATAFLARSARLLARVSALLGRADLEARYSGIADGARSAWQAEYVTADGRLTEESQANYVRGLAFGLLDPFHTVRAADRLVDLIEANGGRLGTGFLSTGQLLQVLADTGRLATAYSVLTSTGVPSWLEMLDRGATTIWEWWDGVDGGTARGSLNHYSKGAVVSFLYTHVAGIRLPENPAPDSAAYCAVTIAPQPGGGITWARASVRTRRGRVASAWSIDDEAFRLEVEIPDGTAATVVLPDGRRHVSEPGTHRFRIYSPTEEVRPQQ